MTSRWSVGLQLMLFCDLCALRALTRPGCKITKHIVFSRSSLRLKGQDKTTNHICETQMHMLSDAVTTSLVAHHVDC